MRNCWRCFEELPGLTAVPAIWRRWMREHFETFNRLCLQPGPKAARIYPCPLQSCCRYRLRSEDDGAFRGICQGDPILCTPSTFTLPEITPLEVNRHKLARALCKAFEVVGRLARFTLPETWQFGAWSEDAVPLILTIQSETSVFHQVIAELALRLGRPYVLLAPTNMHIDAHAQELLAHARAGFFSLDATLRLTGHGTLQSIKRPGELFANFTPQPKDGTLKEAFRRAILLIKELDSGIGKDPTPFTVFRLHCIDGLSTRQIARDFKCGNSTVKRRLRCIKERTGMDPRSLRELSTHFSEIENELRDPRAARINREF